MRTAPISDSTRSGSAGTNSGCVTIRVAVAGKALGAGLSGSAHGQDAAPPSLPTPGTTTIQELAKSLHSPFEDFVKLPVQATSAFGLGAQHDVGEGVNGAALFPVPLSAQWGLIALPSLTAVYLPRSRPQFGLGDLQASFFMTPHADTTWIWGPNPFCNCPRRRVPIWVPAAGRRDLRQRSSTRRAHGSTPLSPTNSCRSPERATAAASIRPSSNRISVTTSPAAGRSSVNRRSRTTGPPAPPTRGPCRSARTLAKCFR